MLYIRGNLKAIKTLLLELKLSTEVCSRNVLITVVVCDERLNDKIFLMYHEICYVRGVVYPEVAVIKGGLL